MSVEAYRAEVGYLWKVLSSRALSDSDCRTVLMFAAVGNPEAARAALEAWRDGRGADLSTAERASVLQDALRPAGGRLSLALARVRAAVRRAARPA